MSFTSPPPEHYPVAITKKLILDSFSISVPQTGLFFAAAAFLVSVPVFFQAPLVRALPWISLDGTLVWLGVALLLLSRPATARWGDLLIGFTWTWLAGSIYWGWLRWEPLLHLPVEAIGLPIVIWCLMRGYGKIGAWFYLGSLFGTAVTDLYCYVVRLIPYWRQVMQVDLSEAGIILKAALAEIWSLWGVACAGLLVLLLLWVGSLPLRSQHVHHWAFSGAVLSAILVDGLFIIAAAIA
ncbi:MAG: DUF3120 domain-containing protein [Synechococcales bacterium]|nr:DUF3120 domain-containing protein [Synechococcales bacterium]